MLYFLVIEERLIVEQQFSGGTLRIAWTLASAVKISVGSWLMR
jgi:hypothetical protein